MIVYGDPSYDANLHSLAAELRHHASLAQARHRGWERLAETRALLVRAGQLEQALEDARADHPALPTVRAATDRAATALVTDWNALGGAPLLEDDAGPQAIDQLFDALDAVAQTPDCAVRVKVPEGFAFYTLYPEQYCAAADKWCDEHARDAAARVLVVGVRSIGTSLSALVAAVLLARGFQSRRTTVRPTGHPFDRRASLDPDVASPRPTHALLVDEGPGISGSSMAAAAQACEDLGVPPDRIAFLPGHPHEPGHAASAVVRERWSRTKRYVVPLSNLRWGDHSLPDLLAAATERLVGSTISAVHDLSAGQWRPHAYPFDQWFPAVCAPFERTKYLVKAADGQSVLWKFAGLTGQAERDFDRLAALSARGWTPAPLAIEHGFIATRWTPNCPVNTDFATEPGTCDALARYVLDAAGPPLSPAEQRQSLERLREMMYWNTKEALNDEAAARAARWVEWMAARPRHAPAPRYGDGHLAPHEWVLAPDGRLVKTDCAGHDQDHTVVGPQSLAWDVAGAMVEWGLDVLPLPKGAAVNMEELPFYRAAYSAFRLGMCALCAEPLPHGAADRIRLLNAAERYRDHLARTLAHAPQ